ncbi:hypothetical protein ACDI16_24160, partial [Oceanobacillus caeni]
QDMDLRIHFKGPLDLKLILKIDREIQKIFNMYTSWDEAISKNIWMVIGDNGHSATGTNHRKYVIDLRKTFKKFQIARIQQKVTKKDQLALCVNQRMTLIYLLDQKLSYNELIE